MKILTIIILFLICYTANSQSLSLFDIDTKDFPTVQAKFWAFDKDGNIINGLSPSDFKLKENGTLRTITGVSCPDSKQERLSIVLLVDVTVYNNIDNVKSVLKSWIDLLLSGKNEVALVSYDGNSYLNLDFTTDKSRLLNAVNNLQRLSYFENHYGAMTRPLTGGISVAEWGKFKKIVLMLSSCSHFNENQTPNIISRANQSNVSLNFVIFDKYDWTSNLTMDMSLKTNGFSVNKLPYDDIQAAKSAISKIYQVVQNSEPCKIDWISGVSCLTGIRNIELELQNQKYYAKYTPPYTAFAKLEYEPSVMIFENPPIGTTVSQILTITGRSEPFIISNITSSNPAFTINKKIITIQPNQSQDVIISYTALDSGYANSQITFENDICEQTYYIYGGYNGYTPKIKTLKLTSPNGGEKFIIKSDTIITWEGITPIESVQLDYSTNNGTNWSKLDIARGLSYKWVNIPHPVSQNCLVKVKQISISDTNSSNEKVRTIISHTEQVRCVIYHPLGGMLVSGSSDNIIKIWDVNNEQLIRSLTGHTNSVTGVAISNYDDILATCSSDRSIMLWDIKSGQSIRIINGHAGSVNSIDFNTEGNILVSCSHDKTINLWEVSTGKLIRTLTGHTDFVNSVKFSPKGNILASASNDLTIKLWDTSSGKLIHTLKGHTYPIRSVAFSPDGTIIASGSTDYTTKIWNVSTGKLIQTLVGHKLSINSVAISPDGKILASASSDSTIKLWDISTGELLQTFAGHDHFVYSVAFSPDGSTVASGSVDKTIKFWHINRPFLHSDQSDAVFSIVAPSVSSVDVDMGKVIVNSSKDSVVAEFVINTGSYPCRIDSIYFRGADASSFFLVSGVPEYTVSVGGSHHAEFSFTPSKVGVHNAEIVIITQADTLIQTITGEGVEQVFKIDTKLLDFGILELGDEKIISDTVLIANISNSTLVIDDVVQLGPDMEQFEIVSGGGSFSLLPNSSHKMSVKFKPKYGGRTSGQIGFVYNGIGSPAKVQLFGTSIGGSVYIVDDSAFAGETKNIKLMLNNIKPGGLAMLASNFEAKIRFQNTLLGVSGNYNWQIINDSTYVTIKGNIGNSNELANIPLTAGLGNAMETTIDIVDIILTDNLGNIVEYDFEKYSGNFKLLGICEEGGTRLINPSKIAKINQISPNPSEGIVKIDINLIESGATSLKIVDVNGQLVEERNLDNRIGEVNIEINTQGYSNGIYFIQLETPTIVLKEKLIITK